MKERLAREKRWLKLSADPSPRHNSAANVGVELVFMLRWMKVGASRRSPTKPAVIMNDC